jgi:hypothetical protein
MDPQHIIDVCEANWDANKNDCNHFVKAVADALGVTLFSSSDNADAIVDKLGNAPGWSLIPSTMDLSTVETDASAGQLIIAGLKSGDFNPPRNNGHVVVVVKGDDSAHPGFPLAYWGKLGGIGAKASSIRNSFIPDVDLPNVKYFGTVLPDVSTALRFAAHFAAPLAAPYQLVEAKAAIESIMSTITDSLGKGFQGDQANRLFFPNGIEDIEMAVKAGPVDISVRISGPKSDSLTK